MKRRRPHVPVILTWLLLLCTGIELVILGSDWELWGPAGLRRTAFEYGAFWPGLLQGWQPNFPGQAWTMFLSYAVLHAGPGHLGVNMITLWSLGREVLARSGPWTLATVCLVSALGGALAYGLLARTPQPMVGASGALFGLAGALLAWSFLDRKATGQGTWGLVRLAGVLVAINLVLFWALDGRLAWQAHLGGALAGGALALGLGRAAPRG